MNARDGRDAIAAALSRAIAAGRAPSAAWWVGGPDGVCSSGALGDAVVEPSRVATSAATPYDLASLTKPLCTALLLVLLEGEGRFDLDEPAEQRLPELRGSLAGRASLRELATHRSRLPAWRPLHVAVSDRAGYLQRVAAERAAAPAGATLYSDLGYIVLGVALERIAGIPLPRLFAERIAKPLGLLRLGFAADAQTFADAAATERGNAFERELARGLGSADRFRATVPRGEVHDGNAHGLGGAAGHAGLFGCVDEVAALACEILRPRRIGLEPRSRALLLEVVAPSERTLGFVPASAAAAARGLLPAHAPGHTGFTGTSLWLDPSVSRAYVLLTNRVHPVVPAAGFDPLRRLFHRLARREVGEGTG